MAQTLEHNTAVTTVTAVALPTFDDDVANIQKLDDEPNDVGGLTAAQLKAEFDKAGETIADYINETLIPAVLAQDSTEEARQLAESERVANEQERVSNENARVSAEATREINETARGTAETARATAETARATAEAGRASAETARAGAEALRVSAETEREGAETARASAESGRVTAENARVSAETLRVNAESARASAENARVSAESGRATAESGRVSAESTRNANEENRIAAEQARADENNGIVAQATAQAQAAAGSASAAAGSATAASESAAAAATSETNASGSASAASGSASAAAGSATSAGTSASAAAESASDAADSAEDSEAWAVGQRGGTDVPSTDETYHNNAKYWAGQAEQIVGGVVTSFNGRSGTVTPQSGDYTAAMVGADASGAAAAVQTNLDTHASNTTIHITAAERTAWNAKQDAGTTRAFTVTLTAAGWSGNAQTVTNANFIVSGYSYVVTPASASLKAYAEAQIYADDVTTAGQMTFHCEDAPSGALTVNVLRMEVQ